MKKANMDFLVGGSILIALLILIVSVLWLKEASLTRKQVHYYVLFPRISTLQVGDPVQVNGVRKGTVQSQKLHGSQVAVTIKLDKDVRLTDSCAVVVQNIGLMGERVVGIILSEKGTPYPSGRTADTTWIQGSFDTGIAEAMGMMGEVLTDVQLLVEDVKTIMEATIGDSLFPALFQTVLLRLDTVTRVAEEVIAGNRKKIDAVVYDLKAITGDIHTLISENRGEVTTLIAEGSGLMGEAHDIVATVDSITTTVQHMLSEIDQGKGTVGKLIGDDQLYQDLKKTIADLDTLVSEVVDDGLKLRVKLGFGRRNRRK